MTVIISSSIDNSKSSSSALSKLKECSLSNLILISLIDKNHKYRCQYKLKSKGYPLKAG